MSLFSIHFLFRYFLCKDLEPKKIVIELNNLMHIFPFNLGDTIGPIYSFYFVLYLVEFSIQ